MAARLQPRHQDEVRAKIQASQLINVLQDHIFPKAGKKPREISLTQMRAIEILLRKSLPDLSAVSMDATVDGKVTVEITRFADTPSE